MKKMKMIAKERLAALKTLVTHANCSDGTGSALLFRDVLPNAEVILCAPDSKEIKSLTARPNTIFCDICPPESVATAWKDQGAIVLDHHAGNEPIISSFGSDGVFHTADGVSGATLMFDQCWNVLATDSKKANERLREIKEFASLVAVKDTNMTKDKRWLQSCYQQCALTFYTQQHLQVGFPSMYQEMLTGRVVFENQLAAVDKAIKEAHRFTHDGKSVMVFSGTELSTNVANHLDGKEKVDVIVGCRMKVTDGKVKYTYSLRSHQGFNCMEFCKRYGGGGHVAASGLSLTEDLISLNPFVRFEILFKNTFSVPPVEEFFSTE